MDRPNVATIDRSNNTRGVRILSFDGGGPGCFSQLVILDEIMSRIAHDKSLDKKQMYPADHFDLMGGVGFGAYTAFMLGSLRMGIKDAMKELHALGKRLETEAASHPLNPQRGVEILKEAVQEMLKNQSVGAGNRTPKVRTASVQSCEWFRTYSSPHSDMECSVVNALCASMALATIFAPVMAGPEYAPEEFSGGGLGFNNPTRELLKEAQLAYGGERKLSLILSLGSGRPKELSLDESKNELGALEDLIKKLTINCEAVERDISYQLYDVGAYIRLNVNQRLDNISFHDWSQLGKVTSLTRHYLQTTPVVKLIDGSIIALAEEEGVMTLGQLSRMTKIRRQAKAPPAVSPYFVVRTDAWQIIESKMVNPHQDSLNTFVITGMGGCGKTQMTAYFVQKYLSRHVYP
ncbi:FabD/lysophospholipase-like protein [Serendipita vermifera]|nr:FabD/lysophospholipase-like protein [Serendipita vermifera]